MSAGDNAKIDINQPDLEKPGLIQCVHLDVLRSDTADGFTGACAGGNCTRNADKPKVCGEYQCHWLEGHGEDADRPDLCGVLIDNVLRISGAAQAKPIRRGAADTPAGIAAIERMSRDLAQPVLVATYPEARMARVVGRGVK